VQALLIALALALWPGQESAARLAALALAGACLGFLPFNFPRARVFLGDVGSHALGAAVFGLLWWSWRDGALGLAQALLLASAVLLDSGLTLLRRLLAGKKVWHAHREHLYQYAVRSGHSHAAVALSYGGWTLLAALLGWVGRGARSSFVSFGLLVFIFVIGSFLYWRLRSIWLRPRSGRKIEE
jgi:UDP-N-acetylmuramyl pentapeptide phosphotransferase/UDP-N-acetylglucosamine-1-phosphate transferase